MSAVALDPVARGWSVTAVADALGVPRPHLSAMRNRPPPRSRGRPPLPDADLVAQLRALAADLFTNGYRRIHALLRRHTKQAQRAAPKTKCMPRYEGLRAAAQARPHMRGGLALQ